jgi:N-methylhydantoinase A
MRYVGQGYEVEATLTEADLAARDVSRLRARFEDAYDALFGMRLQDVPVEAINWRVTSRGPVPEVPIVSTAHGAASARAAVTAERPIYLPETHALASAAVYDRYRLASGMAFRGPAIVEERESTVVIDGPADVVVDEYRNLVITLQPTVPA